jgi:hypothetical protein
MKIPGVIPLKGRRNAGYACSNRAHEKELVPAFSDSSVRKPTIVMSPEEIPIRLILRWINLKICGPVI